MYSYYTIGWDQYYDIIIISYLYRIWNGFQNDLSVHVHCARILLSSDTEYPTEDNSYGL